MAKVLVLVLAGTENHEGLGRLVNALEVAKELKGSGDEVSIIFDGAGTEGLASLSDPNHRAHGLLKAVEDRIAGACQHCARAFGVDGALQPRGVNLLGEFEGHPSVRKFLAAGYQVLSF